MQISAREVHVFKLWIASRFTSAFDPRL
uniref:Uncharacterized protein n=1 Tax=Anguilla anguilla TaxID=7936 RepID=A0A0E9W436_ANGAN